MATGTRGFANPNAGRWLTHQQREAILKAKPMPGTKWTYAASARKFGVGSATLRRIWGLKPVRITPEQENRILALLRDTSLSRSKIAGMVGVDEETIKKRETKSTARKSVRNPLKKRISTAGKEKILRDFATRIDNCAYSTFKLYKNLFLATGIDSALELAQEIRLKLLEQLDYFDPEREKLKGLADEEKIEHFVNFKITKITLELIRVAARKDRVQKKFKRSAANPSSGKETEPVVKNPPMALLGLPEFAKMHLSLQEEIIRELIQRMPLSQKRPYAIRQTIKQRSKGLAWKAIAKKQKVSEAAPAALLSFHKNLMRQIVQQIIRERGIRV